ncbi:unnamed protein product [Heligmosomoides polygyrus]|uniref:N-acetyltransferase domain-containing protein n=1 Tax=Heligmosomoides polygyrus TaxID=6339 RepID=A0A183FX17_HELPZ|nr:unnamed protein product [Heligmosomoides polygyrus]
MLVDMFYLPFECGRQASKLLEQFSWLHDNALFAHGMPKELVAPCGPIVHLFNNRTLLPLSIVNYEIRPYKKCDLEALVALSITSVDYPSAPFVVQKEVFLDKFIVPFLEASPQHCFVAQEIASLNENKVISCVSAHPDAKSFFGRVSELISSLKAKYSSRDDDGFCVDEIEKWYPVVPSEILEKYPAWLDARLLVDAYDAVPTRKLVQVAAATLYINDEELRWTAGVTRMVRIRSEAIRQKFGVAPIADKMRGARLRCSGIFATIPVQHEDHINFFSRIGFSELGKSMDEAFVIFGHLLTVDEEFRE